MDVSEYTEIHIKKQRERHVYVFRHKICLEEYRDSHKISCSREGSVKQNKTQKEAV